MHGTGQSQLTAVMVADRGFVKLKLGQQIDGNKDSLQLRLTDRGFVKLKLGQRADGNKNKGSLSSA
jgi:hypothetical protein